MSTALPSPVAPHPELAGVSVVTLTHGFVTLVDTSDAEAVGRLRWHADAQPARRNVVYARANRNGKMVRLHRFLWELWGCPSTADIDHVNGDGLDNRRANLRPATRAQNMRNAGPMAHSRSGIRGVYFNRRIGRWYAQIRHQYAIRHLGHFDTKEAAAAARRAEEERLCGPEWRSR